MSTMQPRTTDKKDPNNQSSKNSEYTTQEKPCIDSSSFPRSDLKADLYIEKYASVELATAPPFLSAEKVRTIVCQRPTLTRPITRLERFWRAENCISDKNWHYLIGWTIFGIILNLKFGFQKNHYSNRQRAGVNFCTAIQTLCIYLF
jgi:hypothetical protein